MPSEDATARTYSIAVIPGDGIGQEVVGPAVRVIDALAADGQFAIDWQLYPWGSAHFRQHGVMMPADGINTLRQHDAIFFGAVGAPDIPDDVTLWGLLIPIRREFDQYVNLRPVRSIAGVEGPLRGAAPIDMVIVRENTEGEYSEIGGRFGRGTPSEFAVQEAVFTRRGIERVAEYAAELATTRRGLVTSATKSNGILHSMPFWDEVVAQVMARHPELVLRSVLVDALASALVSHPQDFDVIVASNLFGDILSDLAAACVGSIGLAASANINPERLHPSMFEPVHGSAPDIAGKGIANPAAQMYTGALMLDFLGEHEASQRLTKALDEVLCSGPLPMDLGGSASTKQIEAAVLKVLG